MWIRDRVKVVDTTAAGDTFTGYFLAGMIRGFDPGKCLRCASMAVSYTHLIASSSMFYIPSNSKNPDGAYDFLTFICGPEGTMPVSYTHL